MTVEARPKILEFKEAFAKTLFESEDARMRLIRSFEANLRSVPETADAAVVLGTSYTLYPDKFLKRAFTGAQLSNRDKVRSVILSGESDHLSQNENQSAVMANLAVNAFGVDPGRVLSVGGKNTNENIQACTGLLKSHPEIRSLFLISESHHLIRVLPIAQHEIAKLGVQVYPHPVFDGEQIDPNDPRVILELIKTLAYNRILNKTSPSPVDRSTHERLDSVISHYEGLLKQMPQVPDKPFEEWRLEYMQHLEKVQQ